MKKKLENKQKPKPKYLYKPIRRADNNWNIVSSDVVGEHRGVPPPAFFIDNNLWPLFTFGKCEVEIAARNLVEFFAENGGWEPFTMKQLDDFCKTSRKGTAGAALFGLICTWFDDGGMPGGFRKPQPYIVQVSEHSFVVTTTFIKRLMPNGITSEMVRKCKRPGM